MVEHSDMAEGCPLNRCWPASDQETFSKNPTVNVYLFLKPGNNINGSKQKRMSSAFNMLCPRYGGPLTTVLQETLTCYIRAGLLQTNYIVSKRFIKISKVNISNKPISFVKKIEELLHWLLSLFQQKITVHWL